MSTQGNSKIPKKRIGVKKADRNPEDPISLMFAEACEEKMKELGLQPIDVARKVGMQYDTIRKALKGVTFAGNKVLPPICEVLDLNIEDMRVLIKQDKIVNSGGYPVDLMHAFLLEIADVFDALPRKDQKEIRDDVLRRHEEHMKTSG